MPGPTTATPLTASQRDEIRTLAVDAGAAVPRWDEELAACIRPSGDGDGDDADATCTRAAWEQLFNQMYVAHYELLALVDRIAGSCHEALAAVVDAVHGFLSGAGATPTNVAWLDEQQRPPNRFDLELVVEIVRPVPVRTREAMETGCR